jgi:hypothetical protein
MIVAFHRNSLSNSMSELAADWIRLHRLGPGCGVLGTCPCQPGDKVGPCAVSLGSAAVSSIKDRGRLCEPSHKTA